MGEEEIWHFLPEQRVKLGRLFIERLKKSDNPGAVIMGSMWMTMATAVGADGDDFIQSIPDVIEAILTAFREAKLELQVG